ncbi:hypothetical protein GCM10010123_11040 [Pilimelia anulata]|uniref:Uncharacterized protein n=1 Tax=Pilimelia anulata TaxID=53371 RepID=A0A8J3B102_9ACTN|nr:hypothetical protein [Pilimelia anulata]GGJ83213.1 hypothetical protein GCM10010123_11040 [Pilimelia anulata]
MRTHRTDILSLCFALLFLAGAAWWVLRYEAEVRLPSAGWLVVGALGVFGVLGLVAAGRAVLGVGSRADAD